MKIKVDVTTEELKTMETDADELHSHVLFALVDYGDFCGFNVEINVTDQHPAAGITKGNGYGYYI